MCLLACGFVVALDTHVKACAAMAASKTHAAIKLSNLRTRSGVNVTDGLCVEVLGLSSSFVSRLFIEHVVYIVVA